MAYLNSVHLIGRATKAPVTSEAGPSGTSFTTFDLAHKHYKAEKAPYIRIVIFGPAQDAIAKYVKRGQELFIDGRLDVGNKGYSVVASRVEFLRPAPAKKESKGMGKMRQAATAIKKKNKSE